VDPAIDRAIDLALAATGLEVVEVELPGWSEAARSGLAVLGAEAVAAHGTLVASHADAFGRDVADNFEHAARVGHQRLRDALAFRARWQTRADAIFDRVAVLALPVMGATPPPVGPLAGAAMTIAWTLPVNLAGLPALALPAHHVKRPRQPPAGLQLVGRAGAEEELCAVGHLVEAAQHG
jgi:amidase